MNLTIQYFRAGEVWVGWVEEIAGVNSQGRTLTELKNNLAEAAELVIEANRSIANLNSAGHRIQTDQLNLSIA